MITIYGSPKSSAGRCIWCLEEVGVAYTPKSIDFQAGEHKAEPFITLNPNGKVPALVDDDFTIWESVAINSYLAEAYKPELLGEGARARGLVAQWSIWSVTELQPPLIQAFIQIVFVPPARRDQGVIDKSFEQLPGRLRPLELALAEHNYLVGGGFTLADLNAAFVVDLCDSVGFALNDFPNINAWRARIAERQAFQRFDALRQ